MLDKLNRIKNWQAALLILVVGLAVFSIGLNNQFEGDDFGQIVDNTAVHSISNFENFFKSGTYAGTTPSTLSGSYYRPLMTTTYALIYTVFGPHQFYFHLIQLLLCIGSAIILYLFFKFSFKPVLALFLALVFLVHPISSQLVYGIPELQDVLFFFFGITGLYALVRWKSIRSLALVALCLFLSLLSKESGVLFVALTLLYLLWWDRKRLLAFSCMVVLPLALWLALRIHAVGLLANPNSGPIDRLGLAGRLFTAPSTMLFYLTKFIFPWKLASGYYWTYPHYSARHVLVPLLIDLLVVALVVWLALKIRRKASKTLFYSYLFFAIWTALGLGLLLQIMPLDMTACEAWFYFPLAGVLGMIGVTLTVFPPRLSERTLLIVAAILLLLLGSRSLIRGLDWRSQYQLAKVDIVNSQDNSRADSIIVYTLMQQGDYADAVPYQSAALRIYPSYQGYLNQATILYNTGDYAGAVTAYTNSIPFGTASSNQITYEALGYLTLLTGKTTENKAYLINALQTYPHDSLLWMYLSLLKERYGDPAGAKIAIQNAAHYGQISQTTYNNIMNNQSFSLTVGGQTITIP